MKRLICTILILSMAVSLCACGGGGKYGVTEVETLVEQEYSLAFRQNDPVYYYVTGALRVIMAQGTVDELAVKWFGSRCIDFESDPKALDEIGLPEPRTFIIGVDVNSFPMVYLNASGEFWGFDIELAKAVADLLGWELKAQAIEKENVYNELASGNIDCAWGGIALNENELNDGIYWEFGPYIDNQIVVAMRSNIVSKSLRGKTLAMPATPEAYDALESNKSVSRKLDKVTRLVGGTTECFTYLYSGRVDAILTDSTALLYYNCH